MKEQQQQQSKSARARSEIKRRRKKIRTHKTTCIKFISKTYVVLALKVQKILKYVNMWRIDTHFVRYFFP